ncbi:MAG TPA: transketolase [Nitrospinota bacterium]|mgnify:CR=1 FL=1|jgi:transketolase|nr:transketolase [Nitrospinota bacterium]
MTKDVKKLQSIATEVRVNILKMLAESGSGHPGGSLSAAEILTSLYFSKMRHDPKNPEWEERDKFVLSKGHGAPVLYTVLGLSGYFSTDHFGTLRKMGSILKGHPNSTTTPGVEVCTGSLGQGLSQANGLAKAAKLDKRNTRVYVLLGDGELQEGQVWEAAMTARHYNLDNICAIIDNNGLQIDGPVVEIMNIDPIKEKWGAFGWHTIEVDGHNFDEILSALDEADNIGDKPTAIIARTVKGKGVSFMEGKVEYHGVAPTAEELEVALKELEAVSTN